MLEHIEMNQQIERLKAERDALRAEVERLRLAERLADAVLQIDDAEAALWGWAEDIDAYRAAKES